MLKVEGIHTFYGLSHILFDVSLKVNRGQVVCLLGRNGAGKTTTIRLLLDLINPTCGQALLFGQPVERQEADVLVRNANELHREAEHAVT